MVLWKKESGGNWIWHLHNTKYSEKTHLKGQSIPLTVERVSLNAGCSKSFIYKNQEIRDYINNSKQKPVIGKRTYTDLEEANKRIKELEIENMTLQLKNIGLFKRATNLYTRMANLTELNIRNMEEEMEHGEEE